eukprot:GHVU01016981.1.p1 GENE.GHVU01016981.1~~GHVU01016981.1.p1  ORF type:complete len:124 (+),score=6.41 GHVU01016981.1:70-441(+)
MSKPVGQCKLYRCDDICFGMFPFITIAIDCGGCYMNDTHTTDAKWGVPEVETLYTDTLDCSEEQRGQYRIEGPTVSRYTVGNTVDVIFVRHIARHGGRIEIAVPTPTVDADGSFAGRKGTEED